MRRLLAFLARHPWSIGLSILSTFWFIELAEAMREDELGELDAPLMSVVARARGRLDAPMLALTQLGGRDQHDPDRWFYPRLLPGERAAPK